MITKTKHQIRIEQQILYNLAQIVEAFPQYSVAKHLRYMLRKKTELEDSYYWSNEFLLSKVEQYYDELKQELVFKKGAFIEDENED